MDVSEYIDAVTTQMRCKRARTVVAKELLDHIEDQTEAYLQSGMEPDVASREAVRQMGDAVEVGMEMDRLHRPRLDKRTLIIIGIFSVAAMFLQTMIVQALRVADQYYGSSKTVPLQVILGVAVMMAILYLDYTLLGKYSLRIWIALLLFPIVLNGIGLNFMCERIYIYFLMGLLLPAYSGVVFHYRKKKWLGLFCSIGWLLAALLIYYMNRSYGFTMGILLGFSGILLLSYAVVKGWFGISRIGGMAVMWGGILLIGGSVLYKLCQRDYIAVRMEIFLAHFAHSEELDPQGSGYLFYHMLESMSGLQLFESSGKWLSYWIDGPVEEALSFFMVLNELGIVPAAFVLIGLVVLFCSMGKGILRQKNVLGGLLGMACLLSLVLPTIVHVLANLTLLPYTDVPIPFLYPGWVANLASYTLLGFYLSVHRYTDVVG